MSKEKIVTEVAEQTITVAMPVFVSYVRLHKRVSFYGGFIVGGLFVYAAMKDHKARKVIKYDPPQSVK